MVGLLPMLIEKLAVSQVLTKLSVSSASEIPLFRALFYCAHAVHRRNQGQLVQRLDAVVAFGANEEDSFDPWQFIREIPEQSIRYFHGLVEALEIYQSIHGSPVPVTVEPTDDAVREIRQIRDICIQEGLHSIY